MAESIAMFMRHYKIFEISLPVNINYYIYQNVNDILSYEYVFANAQKQLRKAC